MIAHYVRYLLGFLAIFFTGALPADNSPVVVVNLATNPSGFLSQSAISAIFGMRLRKWEDGSQIKVFVFPDENPLHIAFSKQILHAFPYQLRSAWDRLVFSGTGEEPVDVKTEQQMKKMISSTPGAIGYLSRSMVDETIKIITLIKATSE